MVLHSPSLSVMIVVSFLLLQEHLPSFGLAFSPIASTSSFSLRASPLRSIKQQTTTSRRKGKKKKKQNRDGRNMSKPRSTKTRTHQYRKKSGDHSPTPPPLLLQQSPDSNRFSDPVIGETCPHFAECSGCTIGKNVASIPVIASAQRYFASERYDGATAESDTSSSSSFPVHIPTPLTHWRTQAKLVAAPRSFGDTGCRLGLYQRHSHVVVPIPDCQVHHPALTAAVARIEAATRQAGIRAGEELRYVQLQVERWTGRVCVTLVWNAPTLKACQPGLARLVKVLEKEKRSEVWHSVWCHCNDSLGNAIFARHAQAWHRLSGPEYMREPIPVAADTNRASSIGWLYFSPRTFRQGNLDGFDSVAVAVARTVPPGSRVCELYAGVGVLGLTALAWHHQQQHSAPLQWLRCSDVAEANPRAFDKAVEGLPTAMTGRGAQNDDDEEGTNLTLGEIARRMEAGESIWGDDDDGHERTSYMRASATQALRAGQALGASVLIVDPPRKGLEPDVLEELCKPVNPNQPYVDDSTFLAMDDDQVNWTNDIQTLIYVSCGFDALARDCDKLLSSRGAGWRLVRSEGYLLFPGSDHVETLAVFERD